MHETPLGQRCGAPLTSAPIRRDARHIQYAYNGHFPAIHATLTDAKYIDKITAPPTGQAPAMLYCGDRGFRPSGRRLRSSHPPGNFTDIDDEDHRA
jgi:hypothetical protein